MHAQERAQQRYNKELSNKDIESICNSIRQEQYMFVGTSKDDDKKIFAYVKHNHIPYKILFTERRGQIRIITVYPFDVDEYNDLINKKEQAKQEEREQRELEAVEYLKSRGWIVYKKNS